MEKQQWKKRIEVFRYIYGFIMDPMTPEQLIQTAFTKYDFKPDQLKVIEYYANNYDAIEKIVQSALPGTWTWNRIKPILKAILFSSYAESVTIHTPKKVIIDQAIINTKKYSDPDDYKFINAVLDKIIAKEDIKN
ncbi:MAG: transcription antitermination protein NusB [Mycoplasmataceae bacterium]|nr:transcription antitermination protein NusB [Mycoplasmataceae bacterium]